MVNDNQNACYWIYSCWSCRNPITQCLIFVLTRVETRNDLDTFAVYVNTKRNSSPDRGTRVLPDLTSGAEAHDRADEYYAWASQALPDYTAENWATYAEDLLMQARNEGSPRLWREPGHPTPLAKRAAGRGHAGNLVGSPSKGVESPSTAAGPCQSRSLSPGSDTIHGEARKQTSMRSSSRGGCSGTSPSSQWISGTAPSSE